MRAMVGLLVLLAACRAPTEVTLQITTDVPCDQLRGTSIAIGTAEDIEATAPAGQSATCSASGDLGTLVVVPSGGKTDEVVMKVVAGVDREASTCTAQAFGPGCIVARRAVRFVPHENLRIGVPLREVCAGVACGPGFTCVQGVCTSATIADPGACAGATTCDEGSLGAGDAGAPADATVGDAAHDSDASGDSGRTCDASSPFGAPVLVPNVNSASDEWSARLSSDLLTMYLSSSRPGHIGGASIYVTSRLDVAQPWATPQLLGNVNTGTATTVHPAITRDGLRLFMQVSTGAGDGNIQMATRASPSSAFGAPSLVANVNGASDDLDPFVVGDEPTLYLSSNRSGKYGLYRGEALSNGTFMAPIALTGIAGSGDDFFPVTSADELTLFFMTTRVDAVGDIWIARRDNDTLPFGGPTPVPELNQAGAVDAPSYISRDGCTLYMMSNRAGGAGALDVYVAQRR